MANDYLKTLYADLTKKQKSIARYQEKSRESLQKIHQSTYEWIARLEKKYEIIDKFRKSRDRIVPSHFAVEKAPGQPDANHNQEDIKKMEQGIMDANSQLNHIFEGAMKDLQIEMQSYQELRALVNKIYEQFEQVYSGM